MLKHCHSVQGYVEEQSKRRLKEKWSSAEHEAASLNSSGFISFNSSFSYSHDDSRRSSLSSPALNITSRTSSITSLSTGGDYQQQQQLTSPKKALKIYANCLRPDIEYKTVSVTEQGNCQDIIWLLLAKFKMKHRDPNLFYLTMDISLTRTGAPYQRTIVLEDDAKPLELKSCHPWGECKFTLQVRKGSLVRIHDSVLMQESKYKCLLIAEYTTVQEVIRILLHCYGLERLESVNKFVLYEKCQSHCYERLLHPEDRPAQIQSLWPSSAGQFMFVLRRRALPPPVPTMVPLPRSIHQSGLPLSGPSSLIGGGQQQTPGGPPSSGSFGHLLASSRSSLSSGGSGTSSSSNAHDYENFFYI